MKSELGRIVWHDLFTCNIAEAQRFYAELLEWEYRLEHTTDFVWKSGEADYPVILSHGEAHGGLVETGKDMKSRWVSYIRVEDVDIATMTAERLGAAIDRKPFDVPGVGRSAVIQDLQGAFVCLYVPTHHFPPPGGTFLWNELNTRDIESAKAFYNELFGWKSYDNSQSRQGKEQQSNDIIFRNRDDTDTAGITKQRFGSSEASVWVTYLATNNIDNTLAKARTLGATVYFTEDGRLNGRRSAILSDTMGALFGLLESDKLNK